MSPARFGVAALCAGNLFLCSAALAHGTKTQTTETQTTGGTLPEDIIGGTIFSPDGITHIVGDGFGGGFIFGASGLSTFISNGMGGGTLYAPNSTGAIIGDGLGGGILYSPKRTQPSREQASPGNPLVGRNGPQNLTRD